MVVAVGFYSIDPLVKLNFLNRPRTIVMADYMHALLIK